MVIFDRAFTLFKEFGRWEHAQDSLKRAPSVRMNLQASVACPPSSFSLLGAEFASCRPLFMSTLVF